MEELEQPITENGETGSSERFGKFKDAESLLKAYANLESEFTKKSQKLASLETEKDKADLETIRKADIEKQVEDFATKFELVKPFSEQLKATLTADETLTLTDEVLRLISSSCKTAEGFIADENFLNNYVYNNAQIKDRIVKDYLSKLTLESPIKVETSASNIPLTPPRVPTTIKEAGKLAKTIIKQK